MNNALLRWVHLSLYGRILLSSSFAFAGGYDTGEQNWDFLFQQERAAFEAETKYISPRRELKNVRNINPFIPVSPNASDNVRETSSFFVNRVSLAFRPNDGFGCLASYRQPWAGYADYGNDWVGAFSAIRQDFTSVDYGLICSISSNLETGRLHFLAGLSHQEIEYDLTRNSALGVSETRVSDSDIGWRLGVAYEIPEYALRASLIYNSQLDFDPSGTVSFASIPTVIPVAGSMSLPQSAELKLQSGIAPGWLAFGNAKWTDWSVLDEMTICPVSAPQCNQATAVSGLTLLWEDTWTLTAGAAHQLSETFSLAGHVTWDQGASQGFTSQTDTWNFGLTTISNPLPNLEIKLGGSVGILTGGSLSTANLAGGTVNPVGYTATFDSDLVYTLNASLKLEF